MVLYRDAFLADYHGNATSETDARRYRGASRRHHQTRKFHQGTPRHVHGHGDAGGKSGKIGDDALASTVHSPSTLWFSLISSLFVRSSFIWKFLLSPLHTRDSLWTWK